ncbi:MAG: hypothetical protein HOQ24_01295 [Mycobacteriaceae bacterium]|nr:hypothetical protein [Mycobacteriaceae bacterium]
MSHPWNRPTWSLSDLEFLVRWEQLGDEQLPEPLWFTSRAESTDDYRRAYAEMLEHVRHSEDAELAVVFRVLAQPEIRVGVRGMSVARDPADSDQAGPAVRLYLAALGEHAYVVTQRPGETIWHTAGYRISQCSPQALGRTVVNALPATGPGTLRDTVLPDHPDRPVGLAAESGMDYGYGRSSFQDSFDTSTTDRGAEFLATPMGYAGGIEISSGQSAYGSSGLTERTIEWVDRLGDGRYAVVRDYPHPRVAKAVDAKSFAALVEDQIEEVRLVMLDEDRAVGR